MDNFQSKVSLTQLHWVERVENLSITGTRPKFFNKETVHLNSKWINGKPLMKHPYKDAVKSGVIRKAEEIKLTHQYKKKLEAGLV